MQLQKESPFSIKFMAFIYRDKTNAHLDWLGKMEKTTLSIK